MAFAMFNVYSVPTRYPKEQTIGKTGHFFLYGAIGDHSYFSVIVYFYYILLDICQYTKMYAVGVMYSGFYRCLSFF